MDNKYKYYAKGKPFGDVFTAKVKPLSQRRKCNHQWRRRVWYAVTSGWGLICKDCGAICRGSYR